MRFILPLLILTAAVSAAAPAGKPNVLVILSDDLSPRLGCLGGEMKTPYIDALAARGVTFEHAYCQFPLCAPSRASFMSGRRPDATKVINNGTHLRDHLPDAFTMGQAFQSAGYFSGRVGKVFHYGVPKEIGTNGAGDDEKTWNERVNPAGKDIEDENEIINYMPNAKKAPPGERPSLGAALSWRKDSGDDDAQTDGKIAVETLKMIDRHRDKPFFLVCGFFRPHVPDVGPGKYWDMYPFDSVKLPVEPADHLAAVPPIALAVKPANYGIDPENLRKFKQAYYACSSFMDNCTGAVLKGLDDRKLTDNTIVVFFSDHGWLLGEHGQWQKMSLFEWSARVPLIIAAPGMKGNGKKSSRPVELVDVYPTLMDLCNIKVDAKLDGYSLRPLLDNPQAEWSHAAFTQVTRGQNVGTDNAKRKPGQKGVMGRSIRTEKYRYTVWGTPDQGEELYDEQADPNEWHNLAHDPALASLKADLLKQLDANLPHTTADLPPAKGDGKAKGKAKGKNNS
jgi:uncharacterized sulfatase